MKLSHLIAGGLLAAVCTGCTHRMTDFTLISSKNIDVAALGRTKRVEKRVTGKGVGHVVLGVTVKWPNMKDGMDEALEQCPGAVALVDGVIYSQSWNLLIYGQNNFVVTGTPLVQDTSTISTPSTSKHSSKKHN